MNSTPGMQKTFWEYHKSFDHRMFAWKHEVLYTWQWWLGILLTIITWTLWFLIRKKNSSDRLLYIGFFVSTVSVTLDNIGVQLSLWNYLRPVTPAIPSYIPYDFALMPVSVMLCVQFFFPKNPLVIGLIYGIIVAFIGEPLFRLIGIYHPENWRHIYSVPIYTIIYFISHKLASKKQFSEL